jgi:hypothetical protein
LSVEKNFSNILSAKKKVEKVLAGRIVEYSVENLLL